MSQATAVRTTARPIARPASRHTPAPPRLRVVAPPAHTRSRAGLVVGCITLLGSGLIALLLLNVSLEHGSYVLKDQQGKAGQLQDRAQDLREQLALLQAPQNLAGMASRLGMVPNPNAAFLRTSDGRVLGVPSRAVATKAPAAQAPAAVRPAAAPTTGTDKGPADASRRRAATEPPPTSTP